MNQMEGCGRFVKYAVFIVNFIILLGGLLICGVGIWTLVDRAYVEKLLDTNLYVSSAAILVAMGAFIAIVSFMGCCGALKEVKCLLVTFFIILLLIFIVLLVGAILGFVMKDQVKEYLVKGMKTTIERYGNDEFKPITKAWDDVQMELKCCGIQSFTNWTINTKFSAGWVPDSCCKDRPPICGKTPLESNVWDVGCMDKVGDYIKSHSGPLAGIAIAIAVILILGMIFSCALFLMI